MITLSDVHKTFRARRPLFGAKKPDVHALNGVDLHVQPGEIYGVVGPSGAGKSTLLRSINLLERPDRGSVIVNDQDLTTLSATKLRHARHDIGMIFQHFNLLARSTAIENVALPLQLQGLSKTQRRQRAAALLERVGLADKLDAYPAQLSGGQKQRVAIARALAVQPKVLLSDEATSALDSETADEVLALIRQLRDDFGLTVLLITHDPYVVRSICDSAALLQDGRIAQAAALTELTPDSPLARRLKIATLASETTGSTRHRFVDVPEVSYA